MQAYTIRDFDRDFPTDESCLDWLVGFLYPDGIVCKKCERVTKHHRVKSRPSYSCDRCGHHEHPMAGTIFQDTRTPLRSWFYAVFIMAQTRCGISAKQLQRELGVTYKTAWRMFHQIRKLLDDDAAVLSGAVEADETYVGGKRRGTRRGRPGPESHKVPVVGVVERGGPVVARVTSDTTRASVLPIIHEKVLPESLIYTDEYVVYNDLGKQGYTHRRIHHAQKIYVVGDIHTNTIEGFWAMIKNAVRGVYHGVSAKHLQAYVDEYAFRYNHRKDDAPMFTTMLALVEKA